MRSKITTALTVLGAVTVLVLAANTVALAANGKGFLLGKTNTATKVSTVTRTTPGAALGVLTKTANDAPFAVNGKGKVTNLNADTVDGKDSSVLGTRALVWAYSGSSASSVTKIYSIQVPAGAYQFSYEAYLGLGIYPSHGALNCYLNRPVGNLYAGESTSIGDATFGTAVNGTGTIIMPSAGEVRLVCRTSTATTWEFGQLEPLRITAVPIATLTNKGFPTVSKVAAKK